MHDTCENAETTQKMRTFCNKQKSHTIKTKKTMIIVACTNRCVSIYSATDIKHPFKNFVKNCINSPKCFFKNIFFACDRAFN